MKMIYLCGPVTDRKYQEAANHFNAVEKKLRGAPGGLIYASNPMRICKPDFDWYKAMKRCIGVLVICDGIALLQGWQRSRGATLELKLAQDLHVPVVYIEPPFDYLGMSELFTAAPETLRYYNARLVHFHNEGMEESLAENRAIAELSNRYLDPYGLEYIENLEGE
jgi:hypothetical protein